MFELVVSPQLLMVVAAAILAIVFDWFPGLAPWYNGLSVLKKKQLMFGLLVAVSLAIYGGGCVGLFALACNRETVTELVLMVLVAIGVNQGTHQMFKPTRLQGQ